MERWHIVGNGYGIAAIRPQDKVIRFNQILVDDGCTALTITNTKLAGLRKGFLLSGQIPFDDFAKCIEVNSHQLEEQLGCVPSLGLVSIHTLLNCGLTPRVSCMYLLPSLKRAYNLSHWKPLSAAYHNWLGERRLALHWLDNLDWPEFYLQAPYQSKRSYDNVFDCFSLLKQLPDLPREDTRQLWKSLSQISHQSWLEQANHTNMESIESLFYLSRNTQHSPNWWLYDNQLSNYVDRIQKVLAFVQQSFSLTERAKA